LVTYGLAAPRCSGTAEAMMARQMRSIVVNPGGWAIVPKAVG